MTSGRGDAAKRPPAMIETTLGGPDNAQPRTPAVRMTVTTISLTPVGALGAPATALIATSVTPAWDPGAARAPGNLLTCLVTGRGHSTPPPEPDGWETASEAVLGAPAYVTATIFSKTATGGDPAPTIAGIAGITWTAMLAEFDGNDPTPLDQIGSASGSANPLVATAGAADAVVGDLIVYAAATTFASPATQTAAQTLNNAPSVVDVNDGATSSTSHYSLGYGIATTNTAADQCSRSVDHVGNGTALAIATFKPLTRSWPLATLLDTDMTRPHEQIPHGVPINYSWEAVPVISAGNTPGAFPYSNPWGQVYMVASGNQQPGARVEIADLQQWLLSASTGVWSSLYPSLPTEGGAEYPEDFQGSSIAGTIDTFEVAPGHIVVAPVPGRLFHFYPNAGRVAINTVVAATTDVGCVVSAVRVRLAPGTYDPDLPMPGLVANVGADYWASPTSGSSIGVGESRLKTVQPGWRVLTFCTVPTTALASLPPLPFDVGQLY